ncbi:MAG: PEGA domain-containing protein [Enhygromyxa sp.]
MAFLAGRSRAPAAWATALALGLAHAPIVHSAQPPSTDSSERAPKTAILPLVVEGELPETDRETLINQLVGGLQRGSFEIVTPDQVIAAAGAGDCSKPSCIQKIAGKTDATHIVRAIVEVVDRDYTVRVELYDGADGTRIVSASDGCEICGVADVGALIETQAATLRTKLDALASGPASIVVGSDPEGAEVTLDGEPFGVTPLDKPVIPGDHVIRVSKEGYIAVQEKRTFVEGARESLSYELEKVPSRLPKRPWGWASLGVGIAALGGGVALTYMHDQPYRLGGQCTGENVDLDGDCRYLFNTKWYGMGLSLAGGALVTLGVAVLITTAKNPRKKAEIEATARKHLQVGPGGVGVRF